MELSSQAFVPSGCFRLVPFAAEFVPWAPSPAGFPPKRPHSLPNQAAQVTRALQEQSTIRDCCPAIVRIAAPLQKAAFSTNATKPDRTRKVPGHRRDCRSPYFSGPKCISIPRMERPIAAHQSQQSNRLMCALEKIAANHP